MAPDSEDAAMVVLLLFQDLPSLEYRKEML